MPSRKSSNVGAGASFGGDAEGDRLWSGTAGTSAIREVLRMAENPPAGTTGQVTQIKLENASAEEVLMIARPLLGLGEGENVGEGISIAVDVLGTRLYATGSSDKIAVLQDVVKSVDVASGEIKASGTAALEQPQLLTHPIQVADPEGALAVMQTLLAGLPDVRLALDPKTNKIIALARPSEHRTIVETIKQLEGEEARFEVIQLRRIDPQLAVLTINNFFGVDEESTGGIKVDADPTTMKLYLRATEGQLAQVKDLIEKLEGAGSGNTVGGNLRYVPLTGDSAMSTVEMAKRLWSRENQIQFSTPSSLGPSNFDLREVSPESGQLPGQQEPQRDQRPAAVPAQPSAADAPAADVPAKRGFDRSARRREDQDSAFRLPVYLVSQAAMTQRVSQHRSVSRLMTMTSHPQAEVVKAVTFAWNSLPKEFSSRRTIRKPWTNSKNCCGPLPGPRVCCQARTTQSTF